MIHSIFFILLVLLVIRYFWKLHNEGISKANGCTDYIVNEKIDSRLVSKLESYSLDELNFDYVFKRKDIPLGRASAFLNHFERTIYDEEPLVFLCNRSSRDNEFREYGYVFGRTGIYICDENPNHKNAKEKDEFLKSRDGVISFYGLLKVWVIGSYILTVNLVGEKKLDRYHLVRISDKRLMRIVKDICNCVIAYDYGIYLSKGHNVEIIDIEENNFLCKKESQNFVDSEQVYADDVIRKTEKKLERASNGKGLKGSGIQAIKPRFNAFYGEVKHLMDGAQGHGYAAEYANNTMDRLKNKSVESAAQKLDEHGRQIKHGADRLVNSVEVQTKYFKTATETIGAAFKCKEAVYIRSDGTEKMMQIEVPRDQYQEALELMQKRIDSGQVPNVSPDEDASNYVRKGYFTYEQSFNIAKAATIESITVDLASGVICCTQAAGITAVILFAQSMWQGAEPKEALKQSLGVSLSVMGKGTLIYTLTMQLSRKEVANVFAPKAFTADGISQGFVGVSNPAYVLSENLALQLRSFSVATSSVGQKLGIDKVTGRQLIGSTVTVAVVFGPDVLRALQGKISMKQLLKNSAIGAAGMGGAAIGQALIPVPVVGAMAGGVIGGIVAKKTLDLFVEDDAKEMFRILKEEFIDQTALAFLSADEFEKVTMQTIGNKKISQMLQKMYQSKNPREYARISIMQVQIINIVKCRKNISKQMYDNALIEVVTN